MVSEQRDHVFRMGAVRRIEFAAGAQFFGGVIAKEVVEAEADIVQLNDKRSIFEFSKFVQRLGFTVAPQCGSAVRREARGGKDRQPPEADLIAAERLGVAQFEIGR